jgi:metal-responsive CopG/Arc/MetJ family transcriptional regulator
MKTAISLPDKLFHEADQFAQRAGVSRSELYATAITEYLARRNEAVVTARLDAVYGSLEAASRPELGPVSHFPASRADLW